MEVQFVIFFLLYFVSHCSCRKLQEAATDTGIFNVMDYGAIGDGSTDDSQAFLNVWSKVCAMKNGSPTLEVPSGKIFMLKPLQFNGPCNVSPIHFLLKGNIVAPNSKQAWKGKDSSKWIDFSNIDNLIIDGGGQFDGKGSLWWNNCKDNGCTRPAALTIHNCNNFRLEGTHHLNSAKNHLSINNCNNTNIIGVTISAPGDSPNTDGIDISESTNVLIQHSTIATGDDCIAMNDGTSHINITDVTCGPGHGISVGSLGQKGSLETVEHVNVNHCTFKEAENGVRIKTWPGGRGYARNITFEHIILINTKNPIIIDQDYKSGPVEDKNEANNVEISGVTYRDVTGTSNSEAVITLNCGAGKGCTDIFMDAINITSTSSGSDVRATCNNAHGAAGSTKPPVPCLSH